MKRTSFVFLLASISLLVLLLGNCKKDEPKITKQKVTGHVQKGPYINGTSISMFELNSSLEQTGKIFTTEISNNIGSFEISNVSLTTSYVEFSANGYYFDEVKGDISIAPLNLFALSDITDILTVNVNILTHLEKIRVKYLVKQNKTLSEAKNIAQGEILAIFDFSLTGIDKSETLDISVNNDGNAILLAISIILQGNRSVGDLTELLANITNDIREDGILNSESIMTNLRNSTKELALTTIRSNLQNRYQALGINASIPAFEKYINDFLVFTGEKPTTTTQQATNITTTSVTLNGMVNANSLNTIVTFEWGTTASYGSTITPTQSPVTGSSAANVSADITGLLPGTTYHFRVKTENVLGITYSNDLTFTTLGQVPSAVTQPATNIQLYSATINGSVNPNYLSTSVSFEWGTTTSYGNTISSTQSQVTGSSSVNVSAALTGLLPGTTYHFRIRTENTLGITYGNELTFTTLGEAPSVTTQSATSLTTISVTLNGFVNANLLNTIVTFEYGTSSSYGNSATATQSPVTGNSSVNVNAGITGLLTGTTYHFRIKAINDLGTTVGNDLTFSTLTPIVDIEGNIYNIVNIGSQVWMAENLKTTKYSNGDLIGTTIPATLNISSESTPKYQWAYSGVESNVATYGRLYTWYAVTDSRNVCPTGWHIPTDAEFKTVEDLLGGSIIAGGRMKEVGITHWESPNTGADNSSGFSALPGGNRWNVYVNADEIFQRLGKSAGFWTSTSSLYGNVLAWSHSLQYHNDYVFIMQDDRKVGFSVRCVKD